MLEKTCRDFSVDGIDGFEAVNLWYRYKRGNMEALQRLLGTGVR